MEGVVNFLSNFHENLVSEIWKLIGHLLRKTKYNAPGSKHTK